MNMTNLLLAAVCFVAFLTGAGAAGYYGKEVGALSELSHDVKGTVYLIDSTRVRIRNFTYDGKGPGGAFWFGFAGTSNVGTSPNQNGGTAVPGPDRQTHNIRAYDNEDIVIDLSSVNKNVGDVVWLSIWCIDFKVDFGSVTFAASVRASPPSAVNLGPFSQLGHGVRSGDVTLLDSRTIKISALHYDGQGPDAFFLMDKTAKVGYTASTTIKVPNPLRPGGVLSGYTGQTITITLPPGRDVRADGFLWLTIYCIKFSADFGNVKIPANVNVIPADTNSLVGSKPPLPPMSCEQMHDKLHVSWRIDGDNIHFKLTGKLEADEYMAFGLSGQTSSTAMGGADVTVASHSVAGGAKAVDYKLTSYSLCSGSQGACPDTRVTNGKEDVTGVSGKREDGITTVMYTRKLNTGDTAGDLSYQKSGKQVVVWAIGRLNSEGIVTKHTLKTTVKTEIEFGRASENKCVPFKTDAPNKPAHPGWKEQRLSGSTTNLFTLRIGPSGGDVGYKAITGHISWGIAFYVNNLLIPELELKRGVTYTFRVQTGNDKANPAKYHPVYLTNDPKGGLADKTLQEKKSVVIYSGVDAEFKPLPNHLGPLCEYVAKAGNTSSDYPTFSKFAADLTLQCANSSHYGEFTFTPNASTPDLIYYQCFTHPRLGYKIRVVDKYNNSDDTQTTAANVHTTKTRVYTTDAHYGTTAKTMTENNTDTSNNKNDPMEHPVKKAMYNVLTKVMKGASHYTNKFTNKLSSLARKYAGFLSRGLSSGQTGSSTGT